MGANGSEVVIWQEIEHLKKVQNEQNSQFQRWRKLQRLDEDEMAVGKFQQERALIQAVNSLTQTVETLAYERLHAVENVDELGNKVYLNTKRLLRKGIADRVGHALFLRNVCTIETTDVCPCGKHYGLRFVHKVKEIRKVDIGKTETVEVLVISEENMCPQIWWVKLSHLAFIEGNLKSFNKQYPLSEFIGPYMR